jgi:hypothetical protein
VEQRIAFGMVAGILPDAVEVQQQIEQLFAHRIAPPTPGVGASRGTCLKRGGVTPTAGCQSGLSWGSGRPRRISWGRKVDL